MSRFLCNTSPIVSALPKQWSLWYGSWKQIRRERYMSILIVNVFGDINLFKEFHEFCYTNENLWMIVNNSSINQSINQSINNNNNSRLYYNLTQLHTYYKLWLETLNEIESTRDRLKQMYRWRCRVAYWALLYWALDTRSSCDVRPERVFLQRIFLVVWIQTETGLFGPKYYIKAKQKQSPIVATYSLRLEIEISERRVFFLQTGKTLA